METQDIVKELIRSIDNSSLKPEWKKIIVEQLKARGIDYALQLITAVKALNS